MAETSRDRWARRFFRASRILFFVCNGYLVLWMPYALLYANAQKSIRERGFDLFLFGWALMRLAWDVATQVEERRAQNRVLRAFEQVGEELTRHQQQMLNARLKKDRWVS